MLHFLKRSFLIIGIISSVLEAKSPPSQANHTPKELHGWAIQSHREFWTLVGQMAGYDARNEVGYQYVKAPSATGLNYVYIDKSYANSDQVIQKMNNLPFTIFFDADDDAHIFKYITSLKESDDFITMGMDLRKINNAHTHKPGVKVWKVTTDADFDEWLKITAGRRNPKEEPTLRAYFQQFKPSKKNSTISFYLGAINGKVVGSSLMYFSENFTSLYWVGVHPDYRRYGLGSALSFEPLKEAVTRGYRWSVLQAQPLGVPVYPKLGFEKVGTMKVFYYIPANFKLPNN